MTNETPHWTTQLCTAFDGNRRVASGALPEVVSILRAEVDTDRLPMALIFDDATCRLIEVDFRGGIEAILQRLELQFGSTPTPSSPLESERSPKPGRPKLGVVAREVTLLPRHWEWLNRQPGGASVTVRKLVETARLAGGETERIRDAQEACYRFISAMAGDFPGFEEAARALFAGNRTRFAAQSETWPVDIRDHARKLAYMALPSP